MQDKHKKNLYKILFIAILLSFTIILVGCNWLSFGLLNIIDPQAQIRVKNFGYKEKSYNSIVNFEVFSINQAEFIVSSFEFDYYNGTNKVSTLDRTVGAYYYVAPSIPPEVEGTPTPITDLLLYSSAVLDYVKSNSAFNEITCDLYIVGTDSAGHNLKIKVAGGLAALGIETTSPIAAITIAPKDGGDCPLTVIFDGSGSTDGGDGLGITKYEWYLPQVSSGIISTEMSFSKVLACNLITDSDEVITVNLTVTDYYGNEDSAAESVKITNPNWVSGGGCPG